MATSDPQFWDVNSSSNIAIILPDSTKITYERLAEDTHDFAKRLRLDRGPVAIFCDRSYTQYVAYLAAMQAGCPVLLLGADENPSGLNITAKYLFSAKDNELSLTSKDNVGWNEELAVLLSTSGSTGSAKWVRLSYSNLSANAVSIAEYLTLSSADRAPMALPFQYSYGMSVLNSHLSVGATLVLTEGSVVDDDFWRLFEATGCTSFAGVPYSFELMDKANIKTKNLSALRYMTQAGGRLNAARVLKWVTRGQDEDWNFFVMYGQTEASPRISYLPPKLALQSPSSIGIAVPKGHLWVVDEDGNTIPDGKAGELYYQGPNVMMGYAVNDADLLKSQGTDILKTGDIARKLNNGVFEIVGRKSRFVKLFGMRIGLDEVESYLSRQDIVAACISRDDALHIVVERSPSQEAKALSNKLGQWLGVPASSFGITYVENLPRTSSGKTDFQSITRMIDEPERSPAEMADTPSQTGKHKRRSTSDKSDAVEDVFRHYFPNRNIDETDSFLSLGGDSLTFISVALDLEKVIGGLPGQWERLTIKELAALSSERRLIGSLDTSVLVRCVAILLIVSGHFGVFDYGGGGAMALFIAAGWSFGTFVLPQVFQTQSVIPVLRQCLRVAVLVWMAILATFVISGGEWGSWAGFLFIGSWIGTGMSPYWFVEVYLQILIACAAALAIPKVRETLLPLTLPKGLLLVGGFILIAALSDLLVDTHHLFRRLPQIYGWIFLLGVATCYVRSAPHRVSLSLALFLGAFVFSQYSSLGPVAFLILGLFLIWTTSIPFPRALVGVARLVSSASLMIYLTHVHIRIVIDLFVAIPSWLTLVIAVALGVSAWKAYEWFERIPMRKLLSSS